MSDGLLIAVAIFCVLLAVGLASSYDMRRIWSFWRQSSTRNRRGATVQTRPFNPKRYKVSLTELRDFASSLLLGTSMNVTLGQALQKTAEQFEGHGVFGARLNRHVEARLAESPDAVLRGLAHDFGSRHLEDLVRHIEISRQAGARLSDALVLTVENIEEDIRSSVSFEIRKASNQLTVPMILGVFMPIVILGVLPLILDFMERLR